MARPLTLKGIRAEFLAGIESAPRRASLIAEIIPSSAESETYLYAGQVPQAREWTGSREAYDMFQASRPKVNRLYETTLKVDRFEKQDEQVEFYAGRIRDLAEAMMQLEDERVLGDLIDAGESATGAEDDAYDGQAFFDTDHVDPAAIYTTNQSNDRSATAASPTAPTLDEFKAAMRTVLIAFRGFRDDRGRTWHRTIPKAVLLVPPNLESVATEFVASRSIHSGNPEIVNALAKIMQFELVVNDETAATDKMVVAIPQARRMPFYVQHRIQPVFQQVTGDRAGEIDSVAFNDRYDFYGAYSRMAVGFGQWRNACLVTFA